MSYIYAQTPVYINTSIPTCTCAYSRQTCFNTHMRMSTPSMNACLHIYIYIHMHTYIRIHTYICAHIYMSHSPINYTQCMCMHMHISLAREKWLRSSSGTAANSVLTLGFRVDVSRAREFSGCRVLVLNNIYKHNYVQKLLLVERRDKLQLH